MNLTKPVTDESPLAIICGGGSLPLAVADSVSARGRKVLLFPLRGAARAEDYTGRPHQWVRLGQFGTVARMARANGCRDVVCLGSVVRPSFWRLWPDLFTLRIIRQVAMAFRGGDNHLLSTVARTIEQRGFHMLGAHEVAPEILVPKGALGAEEPTIRAKEDIALALDYLHVAGTFDIGQAVVVADRHILAVEAAEGTDAMLARVAEMRASGRIRAPAGSGVLVKAPKRGQDRRFDLPSIGPQTVIGVARAGLSGMAVVAGGSIIAEPEKLIEAADRAKIFVVGVAAPPA